jgi:Protein of unknown function (DUF2628)
VSGSLESNGPVPEEYMELAVGRRWESYYRARWRKLSADGRPVSWNWSAFVLGWPWLTYRKLYWFYLADWGVSYLVYTAAIHRMILAVTYLGFVLAVRMLLGLFGNFILFRSIERSVRDLRRSSATPEVIKQTLTSHFRTIADKKYKLFG